MPELRALALVHGHGVAGIEAGQAGRGEGCEALRGGEEDAQGPVCRQGDAHVAVEEAEVVVVLQDHDGAARIPVVAGRPVQGLEGQAVQGFGAARSLADRREQAQGPENLECRRGVG